MPVFDLIRQTTIIQQYIDLAMTIQQFELTSLVVCTGGLMLFMLFVLYRLYKESAAGGFGLIVIYFSLGLGIFGFAAKSLIRMFVI